jgi:hypothetical protein
VHDIPARAADAPVRSQLNLRGASSAAVSVPVVSSVRGGLRINRPALKVELPTRPVPTARNRTGCYSGGLTLDYHVPRLVMPGLELWMPNVERTPKWRSRGVPRPRGAPRRRCGVPELWVVLDQDAPRSSTSGGRRPPRHAGRTIRIPPGGTG